MAGGTSIRQARIGVTFAGIRSPDNSGLGLNLMVNVRTYRRRSAFRSGSASRNPGLTIPKQEGKDSVVGIPVSPPAGTRAPIANVENTPLP
jgi:hypothetical protein